MQKPYNNYFLLLQINDALFPIGGYTQSFGMETYIQSGAVHDRETAESYIIAQLNASFLTAELLPIRLAYEYAKAGEMEKLFELECISKAARVPSELRSANARLGNRFAKTVKNISSDIDFSLFTSYVERCKSVNISHCIAYGVYCACAEIDIMQTLASYLFSQTSASVTTCVKLVPLSQTDGQKILSNCHAQFESILDRVMTRDENELFSSTAGLDIASMQHETLYSRLYMS